MRNTLTTIFCLFALALLAACNGDHEHGSSADHGHDADHSTADHSHGPAPHSHDAPETEAIYGEDANLPDDVDEAAESKQPDEDGGETDSGEHTHGNSDEPHTHGH